MMYKVINHNGKNLSLTIDHSRNRSTGEEEFTIRCEVDNKYLNEKKWYNISGDEFLKKVDDFEKECKSMIEKTKEKEWWDHLYDQGYSG